MKVKRLGKRLLAVALAAVMCVGLLPSAVSAAKTSEWASAYLDDLQQTRSASVYETKNIVITNVFFDSTPELLFVQEAEGGSELTSGQFLLYALYV
jgi:hypothetical protein